MLKPGAWMISPLLFLPLLAQEEQVLPDPLVAPAVDMITPVPAPEIPFGGGGDATFEMPKNVQVENFGGGTITFQKDKEIRYSGKPGVKVTGDNGLEIFADYAVVNFEEKSVTLDGNVSVYQKNILQRGNHAVYYYERKFLDGSGLRVSLDPLLLEAGKFTVEDRGGKQVFVGENAAITTHDVEDPNFWVRAKKTTIFPDDKIVFNDLRLYAGGVPVFWLPYLSQPLNSELGYHFLPGSLSSWGPFLLNTYGIMLGGKTNPETGENQGAWLLSRWRVDLRAKRGVGVGLDLVDQRVENLKEFSGLSLYYINDLAPETARSGIPRGYVNEDRYQVQLKHRLKLPFPDDANWRLDSNINWLSDQHYLEDFDVREYRTNPAPDNTVGFYRRSDSALLSLYMRYRLNDFYRADTRLPEAAFDQVRAPLFGLPVLHEGKSSLGVIGEKASDLNKASILRPLVKMSGSDPSAQSLLNQLSGYERQLAEKMISLPQGDPQRDEIKTQLLDAGFLRFNTYQEFSMPMTVADIVTIAPQAGIGYTNYSSVKGPIGSLDRTTLHVGAETSIKFSKDYEDPPNPKWGLDGLKHVVQPYAFWSVVSTDDITAGDPMVDRLTPTTRPRPLDPTRFTAVDEMRSWNVVRLGARNRLLTRRDRQSFEWFYLDTYVDGFIKDPEGSRNFSNLYNDLRWAPVPWVIAELDTQFPIAQNGSGFTEYDTRLRFLPTENFEFSLSYRVLNGHPVLTDSNLINLHTYTRLNDYWGFGTDHTLELDDQTLELQEYSIHRDLGNWVAALGLSHRDNRTQQEYGVFLSLTLKDFPSSSLPFELNAE